MAWFKRELADCVLCDKGTGELVYLFGDEFLTATGFHNAETLAQFGIASVWFARYFKRNAALPTLEGGHRTMVKSQLRLKMDLKPSVTASPQWEAILTTYLLEQLGLTADQVDEIKLETQDVCCHSPCYGCIAFDVDTALAQQGEQPFLVTMKAGCEQYLA
jgi:hypothetical protein